MKLIILFKNLLKPDYSGKDYRIKVTLSYKVNEFSAVKGKFFEHKPVP